MSDKYCYGFFVLFFPSFGHMDVLLFFFSFLLTIWKDSDFNLETHLSNMKPVLTILSPDFIT